MKITNFAIIAVLLMLPFFVFNGWHVTAQKASLNLETRYNAAVTSAVQDGAKALTFNEKQEFEAGYGSLKKYRANKEAAVDAFLHSLFLSFDAQDEAAQGTLLSYIPAVMVVDFDGYYLYEPQQYQNAEGDPEYRHVFTEKRPWVFTDSSNNSIGFTLDDTVQVFDRLHNRWEEGSLDDVEKKVNASYYQNPLYGFASKELHTWATDHAAFDAFRRETIVGALQQDLENEINRYNAYAKSQGIAYTFTFPTIDQEQWNNTVDDIGLLAFIQGIPMGDKYYNNYALGGARIVKKDAIVGVVGKSPGPKAGRMYYLRESCLPQFHMEPNYERKETFTDEKDAASKGYMPWTCTNGQAGIEDY
ncbi:hypothetical protein [Tumebacillus flagellatus]|uniref:F0F1-type ATP synthase n=1 Tax=Tumebacillus flagellatus TaxID=1157490 RepID=A0A074LKW4_9BACL|nr:hypothetical protein [Tumebacillus flagellatus]KEO82776.1 hypothetical protein EL26_13585 [Tumebacillus flagellatus]